MPEPRQFCTFFLNEIYFGIEVQHVQEVIRYQQMTRVPLAASDICGLINLRGQIITAIDLRRRLELSEPPAQSLPSDEQLPFNVVVRNGDEVVSLLVDEIDDILELTPDNFEPPPTSLKGRVRQLLEGAYKLKDKLLLILNTDKILEVKSLRSNS